MTDKIVIGTDENTLIIVIRKTGDCQFEAFTEPHPIATGYGSSGFEAVEDMVGMFHLSMSKLQRMEKDNALPMSQQGTLALMEGFLKFL